MADALLRSIVGGKTAAALESAFGLRSVPDAVRFYPRRYLQRGQLTSIDGLVPGLDATFMAKVVSVDSQPMRNRRGSLVRVVAGDGRGTITMTFFNQPWRVRDLPAGTVCLFSGKVSEFRGAVQLTNPEYLKVGSDPGAAVLDVGAGADEERAGASGEASPDASAESPGIDAARYANEIIPVYPGSGRLPTWRIAAAVDLAVDSYLSDDPPDPIPAEIRERLGLVDHATAIRDIHRPADSDALDAAERRLVWEEAFVLQAELARRRAASEGLPATPRTDVGSGLLAAFDQSLPYELTPGQRRVADEIAADLAKSHPMHRLLQGEVGSGKTVVAVRAMLAAVDAGAQAVLLAPTEVLATQHHRSVAALLGPLGAAGTLDAALAETRPTRVVLLTGSTSASARREALAQIASGEAGIVIGTHALLSEGVEFAELGLVVVDEQHRFGVEQRAVLAEVAHAETGARPHVLVMTATPIPRTVAMTVFGDLDVSVLDELPRGRAGITSHVVPADERPDYLTRAWERIAEEVAAGHKAFIVCPRINPDDQASPQSESEPLPLTEGDDARGVPNWSERTAVVALAEELRQDGPLASLRIGEVHGAMNAEAKDQAMRRFALPAGDPDALDVLVATTVIEVGVDVPEATVMLVMDADAFGASQLHQLRGRVGRGAAAGLCLLMTRAPVGTPARERVEAVAATQDGFALAEFDLGARGEGDVLGRMQSGERSGLRKLEVLRHADVIAEARDEARALLAADPELTSAPGLLAALDALAAEATFLEKS